MVDLNLSRVCYQIDKSALISNVSLTLTSGDWFVIAGRNGSGKSTLLRLMAGLLQPTSGEILLNAKKYCHSPNLNKELSVMSQKNELISNLTVIELVRLGRYPHIPAWKFGLSIEDHEAVEYAIDFVGLNQYSYRAVDTLSGGERQRAFLALALAKNGSVLFLDEPTNHLDIVAQRQVLNLLGKLAIEGKIIVTVLHDLNHMARYATKLALLREGNLFKFGSLDSVYTSLNLSKTFDLDIEVIEFNQFRSAVY
ncbi:iron ABC transporter/ ATPase component [Synechococcus sp. A15-127]|uniref:ABC transporter ATP-binding protein n=1 Tax=Synechococcus sp. A15-127 TaxID=1050624 RepID=UPI0016490561|nr:ABC transporter ATP-binding protein [Synechococcus sp. A15-127]QNI94597.1 iron ABC transporter/ ATPase component [Synechococcus sp. A15-127]